MTHLLRFLLLGLLCAAVMQAQQSPTQHQSGSAGPQGARSKSSNLSTPNAPVNALGQTLYSHGDPSNDEQMMLEYINRARMYPAAEADTFYNTKAPEVVSWYAKEGVDIKQVRSDFKSYSAKQPLAFHPKVLQAAHLHTNDMRDNQYFAHNGLDGSTPFTRMGATGYTATGGMGENIAYSQSVWEDNCLLMIDWNYPGQGHRHNLMAFSAGDIDFTEIGIGIATNVSGSVGPVIVTEDFGRNGTHYVTGVVYKDKNNNGMYDQGEGLSGVTITPSTGDYYAVTSSSGGYAFPTTATGNITVTASGNGMSGSKSVSLPGNANVKVDFNQSTTPSVILSYPIDQSSVNGDTTRVGWTKLSSATLYHLQVSMSPTFSKMLVNDSAIAIKDTSYVIRNLQQDSTYYWRVRAKSSLGWGDFVPAYQFNAVIYPSTVQLIYPAQASKLKDKNITFKWTQSKPGVQQYWFEIARDSAFTDYAINNYEVTDTTWVLDDPDGMINKDTTYYWHVAGYHNASVQSAFSAFNSFIISDVQNGVNEDKAINVSFFGPNPVNSLVVLHYQLQNEGNVSCTLCDERGQSITILSGEYQNAGEHYLSLDFTQAPLAQLQAGAYIVRMQTASGISTRKIVLQR